jgi:hypothetical protein
MEDDRYQFNIFMNIESFYNEKYFDEAIEWLQSNAKGKWERYSRFFTFSDKEDAFTFRLFWGE